MNSVYKIISFGLVLTLSACASAPKSVSNAHNTPKARKGALVLPDKVAFLQTDKRWANKKLGGKGGTLKSEGCLVTAAAMALHNLGFKTNPGDLTKRLKAYGGFNKSGALVWSGIERATAGKAQTVFTHYKDDGAVRACLKAGYYPLVNFSLPSSRSHWATVIGEAEGGFYVRDPAVKSATPIPLSSRTKTIKAVRCIGVKA